MPLSQFSSELKKKLFEELQAGRDPSQGSFDEVRLKEGRAKGSVQMGSTHYGPDTITVEFIFPDSSSTATVLSISVQSPERIVFLPVPEWIVESIWQGDISGSYHFESDALKLVEAFRAELDRGANRKWFERQQAKHRE